MADDPHIGTNILEFGVIVTLIICEVVLEKDDQVDIAQEDSLDRRHNLVAICDRAWKEEVGASKLAPASWNKGGDDAPAKQR